MASTREGSVLPRAAWLVALLSMLLAATVPFLESAYLGRPGVVTQSPPGVMALLAVTTFTCSGAWLIQARPTNAIGWLLLASGALQGIATSAEAYGGLALTDPGGGLPLGLAATWLGAWTWAPSVLLVITVLPPLYPSGTAPSTFWRWQLRSAAAGTGLATLLLMTSQAPMSDVVAGTRLPWDMPGWWTPLLVGAVAILLAPAAVAALVGTIVRAVRARSPERQQILLLVVAVAIFALTAFFTPGRTASGIAFAAVPVTVAIGVLRYHLLGIEVALRRTLLYVPLTLLVALSVGASTTVLARLLPEGPLPLVIGSALAAVLIFPVAGRLRTWVDRFVLGEQADPLATVDSIGAGLRTGTGDPTGTMLEAVAAATGASYAELRTPAGVQTIGQPHGDALEIPLVHADEELGMLAVGPRRGERRVTNGDARLLAAIAPHLAVVIQTQRLASDLDREKQRVASATEAERDRLRHDLHDGLGPSLSGIALGLQAVSMSLGTESQATRRLLERTRIEAENAVREIRRVIDGLRPAVLDKYGLVGAIGDTAQNLGLDTETGFTLDAPPLPDLAPQVEEAAFRIASEALNNVAKHANASSFGVTIETVVDQLVVRVRDDGTWVTSHSGGVGLDSMKRRVKALGGELEVTSDQGTTVTARIPLEQP